MNVLLYMFLRLEVIYEAFIIAFSVINLSQWVNVKIKFLGTLADFTQVILVNFVTLLSWNCLLQLVTNLGKSLQQYTKFLDRSYTSLHCKTRALRFYKLVSIISIRQK